MRLVVALRAVGGVRTRARCRIERENGRTRRASRPGGTLCDCHSQTASRYGLHATRAAARKRRHLHRCERSGSALDGSSNDAAQEVAQQAEEDGTWKKQTEELGGSDGFGTT